MAETKTSTFVIDHDRCKPETWTAGDILALAEFVKTGALSHARHLARLGMQLVMSELLVPKGGTLEEIGWCEPGDGLEFCTSQLDEIVDADAAIFTVHRLYRGPAEYAFSIPVGHDGEIDGHEYETKPTEAQAFLDSMVEPESQDAEQP